MVTNCSLLVLLVFAFMNVALPDSRPRFVANIFDTSPIASYLHLGFGFVAMFIGAFQLNSFIRTKYLSLHRSLGKVYVVSVLLSGVAGFLLALKSAGGLVTHVGFAMMAVCWLFTTIVAYISIKKGDVDAHRDWMIRSYAHTLAGVTLRIYLGLSFAAGLKFSEFYPVLSWICWVPNLLLVEWLILAKFRSVRR
jgi:uncharacterized membrane protein